MKLSIVSVALAALCVAGPGVAQEVRGPVRIIVGFAPGGAVDTVARALAESLRVTLKQTVIIDNKPGAAQRLALSEIKRSKPDGQTLVLANNSPFTLFPHAYKRLEFDPIKDFTPIARISTYDLCVAAGPMAPAGGIKEVVAWAKANPKEAAYGTSGAGSIGHFVGVMFNNATGAQLNHVPYKGGVPALTDLAGGQVPTIIDTILEPMEMAKTGKVRILATTGKTRTQILPNVPTLAESGINVTAEAYLGVYGPANMPAQIVQQLDKAVKEAMASPELQRRIVQAAMSPAYANGPDLAIAQAKALAIWEAPIKSSGFEAD